MTEAQAQSDEVPTICDEDSPDGMYSCGLPWGHDGEHTCHFTVVWS